MARIKKDKTNYGGRKQYADAFKIPPEEAKHSSRKNTRKWCRGRVGIKHLWALVKVGDWGAKHGLGVLETWQCATCSKKSLRWR